MSNVLIGKKLGMSQIYDSKTGAVYPVTVLDVKDNVVSKVLKNNNVSHLEISKDKKRKSNKSDTGNYKELGFVPLKKTAVRIDSESEIIPVSSEIDISKFEEGSYVDVKGVTKGKGFAGVVKRYKMKGGPRTHGQSDRERAIGSIGMRTIPGRVWKGKRMAGHMGVINKTIKNLKIVKTDLEEKVILVKGSVPGANGSYVLITKAE